MTARSYSKLCGDMDCDKGEVSLCMLVYIHMSLFVYKPVYAYRLENRSTEKSC